MLLSILVIRIRIRTRISIGTGEDKALARMSRVFGNFVEYAPIALLLLALVELCGGSRTVLHIAGSAFIVGRIAHAIGLGRTLGINIGRTVGVGLTSLVILGLSASLFALSVPKLF